MNMSRFAPYLGIVAALILWVFVAIFFGGAVVPSTLPPLTAPPTLSIVPGLSQSHAIPSPVSPPSSPTSTQTTTTPSRQKKNTPPAIVQPSSTPAIAPAPQPSGNVSLDAPASALRAALVNIICYVPTGSNLHSISGSGVIINPKGIILTNAHVAQYFLLADRGVSCTIRSGSPAVDRYRAKLIFISPAWINANANVLTEAVPSGTGEYDFALLAVTGSAPSAVLPSSFQFLPLATTPPRSGTPVVIASYGAQFLASSQIQSSLFPTVVFGSVKDVFTFATNTVDVLALGGSAAAQEGSSGGGVANANGELAGTITTSTVSGDTSTRSLGAITASYIRADYASETGKALDLLLAESTTIAVAAFAPKLPVLESVLVAHLP
ncbi:MAG: S1 family peptidase [Minisyncoccota bacterium]